MPTETQMPQNIAGGSNRHGAMSVGATGAEHLHLHMRRTHWETKNHPDLGPHLQDALDALDREGWEVVAAYCVHSTPEVILRREKLS